MHVPRPARAAARLFAGLVLATAFTAVLSGCGVDRVMSNGSAANATPSANSPSAKSLSHRAAPVPPKPTRRCTSSDLAVQPTSHKVIIGVDVELFTLTTKAADGCTLTGTPHLIPKGPLSRQLPADVIDLAVSQLPIPDDLHLKYGSGGTIALLPGARAAFYLAWFRASPIVCVRSSGFGFDVLGDTSIADMQNVTYPVGPMCDGIFYVSPVFTPHGG